MRLKALVVNGLGIGCHEEIKHAFEEAGAEAEIVHIRRILSGDIDIFSYQILNLSGGFLHGDMLGAGICAANELEHSGIKDKLLEYAGQGNIIYGQCNGFQLLVKTGLLPGINNDYSKQTVTLTHNDVGNYRVDLMVPHIVERGRKHFAFEGIEFVQLACRHGEGKLMFHTPYGLMSEEQGETNRQKVNENHVLLRYVDPDKSYEPTTRLPNNPNGSVDGIAGLVNRTGNIFGHMAHPEVSVHFSRNPTFFRIKDQNRRMGIKSAESSQMYAHDDGYSIFANIVKHVR